MTASTFSNILKIERELYKMWNQNPMTGKEEQSLIQDVRKAKTCNRYERPPIIGSKKIVIRVTSSDF